MPGKRITDLTALSGAGSANNDDVVIFDATANETKRISRSQLAEGMQADVQVLTNKTLALGSNTVTGTTAQFNTALTDNNFATQAGSEVLTNKTINARTNTLQGSDASRLHWFKDVAALLADTALVAATGDVVQTRAEGFAYQVVTSGEHLTTAGGVKLYRIASRIPTVTQTEAQTLDFLQDGDLVFVTDLYGGSYYRAKDTAEVIDGQVSTAYTFADELTFYRTASGKPFVFDINLNADLLRRLEDEHYIDFFAKQIRRDVAQNVAMYGDSLTFGQAAASAAGASNLIGVATNYGDGSTFQNWQYDQNIPKELSDGLAPVRASALTVHNRGYSGDRAWNMYLRHRTPPTAGVSIVWASSVNDVAFATSNAATTPGITTDAEDGVAGYTEALRRFVAREILRGNSIVIMGPPNYSGSNGWDGFSSSAMRLSAAYNNAAKAVAEFFDVQFVDVRKEILDQYFIGDIQADSVHFNPVGCKVMGRRLAALFVGDGWRSPDCVQAGSIIVANPATANILSQALTPPTVNVSPQSGGPGLISANPTTLNVVSGDPIMMSFYSKVEDLICYVNGKAIDATVTIDLDGAALQQDYQSAISAGKTTQPSGSAPVSTRTEAYSGTHLINRVSKRWNSDDGLYFHVSGKGWHTLTITKDSGTTAQFDGLEFQSWENERKPREELIFRATDSAAIQIDTTFTADDVLTFDMLANEVVNVEGFIRYNSGVTPGFKWYLLGPTSWTAGGLKNGTDPRDETSFQVTVTEAGSANNRAFKFNATVTTGVNAGTISFMWAQSVSTASDTKVLAGSYLNVKRR